MSKDRVAELTRINEERYNEIRRLTRALANAQGEIEKLESRQAVITTLSKSIGEPPRWLSPRRKVSQHEGTPVLLLSDLHLDEVVDRREMDGMNEYNRVIADERLERVINGTADYLRTYTSNIEYTGIVIGLLGDIITGAIHEELAKTNEAGVPATIVHWVPKLAAGLDWLQREIDAPMFVPCVTGNHDRTGKRIQYKNRAEESYAWIIYHWLADKLAAMNEDITVSISESDEIYFPVYDTRFLAVHGDGTRGGSGIGGIWPPIMRYVAKKQQVMASINKPFDHMLMGHWHQLVYGTGFVINGSLKGYDEYARGNSFGFERPQQALFVVTPENGITMRTSVFAD